MTNNAILAYLFFTAMLGKKIASDGLEEFKGMSGQARRYNRHCLHSLQGSQEGDEQDLDKGPDLVDALITTDEGV
jgi:hypothetical protein